MYTDALWSAALRGARSGRWDDRSRLRQCYCRWWKQAASTSELAVGAGQRVGGSQQRSLDVVGLMVVTWWWSDAVGWRLMPTERACRDESGCVAKRGVDWRPLIGPMVGDAEDTGSVGRASEAALDMEVLVLVLRKSWYK